MWSVGPQGVFIAFCCLLLWFPRCSSPTFRISKPYFLVGPIMAGGTPRRRRADDGGAPRSNSTLTVERDRV